MKNHTITAKIVNFFILSALTGIFGLTISAKTFEVTPAPAKAAPAAGKCSAVTLRGGYGYRITGTFFVPPDIPILLASVGRIEFDGAGSLNGQDTTSFGGVSGENLLTGTYTVGADCLGSMNVTFENGFSLTGNIVIVNEGKEIYLVTTTPGQVTSGHFIRQ